MARLSFTARLVFLIILLASVIVPSSFTITWPEEVYRLTTNIFFDGLPSITETDDGRIWVVWAKAVMGDNTLFYKTSSDSGVSWSDEKNITETGPGHSTSPSIVQLTNGTIMVVWSSNSPPLPPSEPDFRIDASPRNLIIEKGHSDNSMIITTSWMNFSEPVNLSVKKLTPDVTTTFDPNPVTPPSNATANSTLTISVGATANPGNYTLTVLGISGDKSHSVNILLEIIEVGGSTNNITPLSSSSVSSSETVEDYEIYCKRSSDNGATWSNRIQLTDNTVDDLSPSVVQLTNGTIMVVWQSDRTGNPDIFYKKSNGTLWSDANQLTADSAFDKGPSIMQANDGRIWVAWTSDRTEDSEIFYKICEQSSWSNATRLTTDSNIDITPSILQTIDDTIWIFWTSYKNTPGATDDIYYRYSSDNGVTWSDSIQFTTDSRNDMWPAVTKSRDGRIWAVWTSDRDGNWEIYYRFSDEIVIHDVAITHVEPATSPTPKIGDSIAITVVAENQGSKEESFDVSCFANSISIGFEQVPSLSAGSSTDIHLTWDTAGFAAGVYVISATASSVEGEADIEDNTFTDGTVELMEPIHDVAVIDVTPDTNVVLQGNTISIDVTTQNQGTEIETFDVSCYVDSTSTGSQTITLDSADSTLLTFTWDTSGFPIGSYLTSANTSLLPDEDDINDNIFIDGTIEVVAQPVHDIAIIGLTPSPTTVSIGQPVDIEVTARNEGTETETFSITVKYDDTEIGTPIVTSLPSGKDTTETFTWDTTGVLSGNYIISAEANLIPGETDTHPEDNTFIDGGVTVLPYRDVAITNVTASPTTVTKPEPVNINVTVLNEGELTETFNVTTYYEDVEVDFTQTDIILEAGVNITLTFIWDTTAVDEGTYTVSAKVSVVPYETDTLDNIFIDGDVTVTRPLGSPVASFTWSPLEPLVDDIITFNGSESYDPEGLDIISYEWDFGDSTTNAGMVANHTYTTTGRYRVTLTVEDVDANTDSVMRIVTVYRRDVAIVGVTAYLPKVVVGDSVPINVTVLNKGGLTETFDVTLYYDTTKIETQTVNSLLPGANTTLTFVWDTTGLATGEYVLKAEASMVPGETNITDNSFTNGQVTLGMLPSAIFTFSPSTPVVDEMITFNATGSTPNGGVISQYMWDFGDGITGWGVILEHSYASLRTYEVKLTVTDSEGLTDSTTRNVTVNAAPVASFTYTPSVPKVGEVVTFNASASYSPEESAIVGFTWDFGDRANGTGMIETHTYTDSGTYVVMLTVKDVVGNEDTDSVMITVAEAPLPFSPWSLEILGVVIAIVALGLVLTVLFFRKRKAGTKRS